MEKSQNALKEVDLQIIYRRLEARKRDITKDGQMSKQQIASAYRGYHGLEKQYHALTQMSNQVMMSTKLKNDLLHIRLVDDMKTLNEQEKLSRDRAERNLQSLREDFTAQIAYQYIYRNHSFKRQYQSQQQQKKPRPVSDKPEMYEPQRKASARKNAPRKLGSLREMENYKDELKLKFPPIPHIDHNKDVRSPRVNALEGKTYETLKEETKHQETALTSFPSIEHAMGVEVKFKNKIHDDDKLSIFTAPPAGLQAEEDDDASSVTNPNKPVPYDMGQNLLLMRRKEQERIAQRRILPATPKNKRRDDNKEAWKRVLPETPPVRTSPVYLDTFKLKKMMRQEVTDLMDSWSHHSKRLDILKAAKDHNKSALADNPIPVFDRSRPTSAILREFQEYKKIKEEQHVQREAAVNDQAIIVRQMSPQPRMGSPIAQSRSEFMNASRAVLQRENSQLSVTNQNKLRRTESEVFPSVSRTTSYKDVYDTPGEIHENALLTAAERIELEKQKRDEFINEQAAEDDGLNEETDVSRKRRPRRKLPQVPIAADAKADKSTSVAMTKTNTISLDIDVTTVKDEKHGCRHVGTVEKTAEGYTFKREENPHVAEGSKSVSPGNVVHLPVDPAKRIKDAGALYGKKFWPRLNETVNFNYDNFTRTTPECKRRLEQRAKNRRKIQQKNAQLREEAKGKTKGQSSEVSSNVDRPSTRVSFNENVIVIQRV